MSSWAETMDALLGKRVEVTLVNPRPDGNGGQTITGTLVAFDPFGGVAIRTDAGELRDARPNLHIREVPIADFRGPYRFLSNFYPSPTPLMIGGHQVIAHTVEHAYQASKTMHQGQAVWVLHAPTPGEAKRRGRRVEMTADWDTRKIGVMRGLLRSKFAEHTELARWLLATGEAELVEGNHWGCAIRGNLTPYRELPQAETS